MSVEYNDSLEDSAGRRGRSLEERLAKGPAVILDGAMGTQLEKRGMTCTLPLWSTEALLEEPELITQIHEDYAYAGAEILTANTFRTQERTLRKARRNEGGELLTQLAVTLAKKAAEAVARRVWVAGSVAPLEDCYRPDLVPDQASLENEHAEHIGHLRGAGVDLILIETMNKVCEVDAAAHAAAESGLPFFSSFVCAQSARLLSGEHLRDAAQVALAHGALCVMVNCLSIHHVSECLAVLESLIPSTAEPIPRRAYFGAYPNLGAPEQGEWTEPCTPEQFSRHGRAWMSAGARVLGGCCGTTPLHIRALSQCHRFQESKT